MPEGNVEVVRRAFDAWNRNDWEELGRIYHPEIVAVAPEGFPEAGEFRGWEELKRQYRGLKSAWESEQIRVEEVVAEGDQVVARVSWAGIGKASGAPMTLEVTDLVTVEDQRVTRIEFFWRFEDALEAMRATRDAQEARGETADTR